MTRVRLGTIVDFVRGVTFDGGEAKTTPSPNTLPILRAGNIGPTLDTTRDLIWIPAQRVTSAQRMVQGDIAICMSSGSAAVVGKSAILELPFEGSVGAFCGLIRARAGLLPKYLALWLRSERFLAWRDSQARGASIQNLRFSELAHVEIELPSLQSQRSTIERLEAQIAATEGAREAQLRRSEAAVALTHAAFAREILEPHEAPWPEVQLRDVVQIQLGKMLSPASKTGARPIPYLRNFNVKWDRLDLTSVSEMDFSEAEEAKFGLQPGDVLVCEGGEPGRAAIWEGQIERCCYQKALHRLRPLADGIDPRFLLYRLWLGSLRGEFVDDQSATTIAHLPAVRLETLRIRLPRLAEQRRIAHALSTQLETIAVLSADVEAQTRQINELTNSLVHEVFG